MTDLFVVADTNGFEAEKSGVVVRADSAPEAAVAASAGLPVPYLYSDGTAPPRKLAVYRAEKVGEFNLKAEEA